MRLNSFALWWWWKRKHAGSGDPQPDPGYVLLVDADGAYLTDADGAYLQEPA